MNARLTFALALALLPLASAARAPGVRIAFAPAEGSSAKKTFETKLQLTLDDLTIEGPAAAAPPRMELSMSSTQRLVVEDDYEKLRPGSPVVLVRSYESIGADMTAAMTVEILEQTKTSEQSMHGKSELEGKRVRFAWNEESGAYDARFEPAIDKPKLLEGLAEDLDLRALLPRDEVEIGGEWTIEARDLVAVLSPGGNLSVVPERANESSLRIGSEMGSLSGMLAGELEGQARAKLDSVREEDGVRIAVIRLDLEAKSKSDLTETARKALEETDLPPEVEGLVLDELEIEYAFEGEGELLWDLSAGRFRSLSISGAASVESNETMTVTVGGKPVKVVQRRALSGQSSLSAKSE